MMYYFFFQKKYNSSHAIFDKDWSNDPQLIKMWIENDIITSNNRDPRYTFVAITVR